MFDWMLVGALSAAILQPGNGVQAPPPLQEPVGQATTLEDVVIERRELEALVRNFVGEVGAPATRRGLARWQDEVCVGAVNIRHDAAQYIIDRISLVGMGLGLRTGDPGCTANVLIIFTNDASELATTMLEERRPLFRVGLNFNRNIVALRDFQNSDRAVRWWHVSVPTDSETGRRAVRIPGATINGKPSAPVIAVFAASRLNSQIRDDLNNVMVIVDVDQLEGTTIAQLADYLAFVALAQIDPDAETSAYDTILNLFDSPHAVGGLTDWDMSYLSALYRVQNAPVRRINPSAQASAMAGVMLRDRRAVRAAAEEQPARPE